MEITDAIQKLIDVGKTVRSHTLEGCQIRNSFIGPFSSIGAGTMIEDSSIEHSVILESCHIVNVERLADSLIGKDSKVAKQEGNLKPKRLFVGDDANIEL